MVTFKDITYKKLCLATATHNSEWGGGIAFICRIWTKINDNVANLMLMTFLLQNVLFEEIKMLKTWTDTIPLKRLESLQSFFNPFF